MKIRSAVSTGFLSLTLFCFALPVPSIAHAAKAGKSATAQKKAVTLGAIKGQKGDTRKTVIAALEKDFAVTDADGTEAPAKDKDVAQLAQDLGSDVIIFGKLDKAKLTLVVRSASNGKVLGEVTLKGGGAKLKKAIQKNLASEVSGLIGGGGGEDEEEEEEEEEAPPPKKPSKKAPVVEDEEDAEDAADAAEDDPDAGNAEDEEAAGDEETGDDAPEDDAADDKPGTPSGLPGLVATVGIKGISRKFDYKDRLADLRPGEGFADPAKYSVVLPAIVLRAELYPLLVFGESKGDFLENLGIAGAFEFGLPTKSSYVEPMATGGRPAPRSTELENRTQDWWVGPRLRLGFGSSTLGFTAAFGQHKFFLVGDEGDLDAMGMDIWPPPLVPDVKYTYIRLAGDFSFELGALTAGLGLGVRKVLSYGELDSVWFPGVTGDGLEANVLLGYHLSSMFTAVGGLEMLRYGFDLNAIPDDNKIVAGGALDTYLMFWAGIRMTLPSSGSASVSASTE